MELEIPTTSCQVISLDYPWPLDLSDAGGFRLCDGGDNSAWLSNGHGKGSANSLRNGRPYPGVPEAVNLGESGLRPLLLGNCGHPTTPTATRRFKPTTPLLD